MNWGKKREPCLRIWYALLKWNCWKSLICIRQQSVCQLMHFFCSRIYWFGRPTRVTLSLFFLKWKWQWSIIHSNIDINQNINYIKQKASEKKNKRAQIIIIINIHFSQPGLSSIYGPFSVHRALLYFSSCVYACSYVYVYVYMLLYDSDDHFNAFKISPNKF